LGFGQQGSLVRLQIIGQLLRHGLRKGFVGQGRAITGVADKADFILQLHHDRRADGSVHFLDVMHEGREGFRIGVAVGSAHGGQHLDGLEAGQLGARETVLIRHDPGRGKVGEPVLPAREPEPRDPHVVGAGIANDVVRKGEVVLAFLGLDPGPGDRASTVLRPTFTRCGQTVFMYSGLEAAVLVSSPPSARNGLPSTINWVAAPRFSRWATGATAGVWARAVTTSAKSAMQLNRVLFFMAGFIG